MAEQGPQNPFKAASDSSKSSSPAPNFVAGDSSGASKPKPQCWPNSERKQEQSGGAAGRANPKSIPAKGPLPMVANVPQQSGQNPPTNQPGNKPGDASPKPYKLKGA